MNTNLGIEVKFCTKCGSITNFKDACFCPFCKAPLRKLAKITHQSREPTTTNKGVNYLSVLKTFNPVNRESKYYERVERDRVNPASELVSSCPPPSPSGGLTYTLRSTDPSARSPSHPLNSQSAPASGNPYLTVLKRAKRSDFTLPANQPPTGSFPTHIDSPKRPFEELRKVPLNIIEKKKKAKQRS